MEPTFKGQIYQYALGISAGLSTMSAGAWLGWPSVVIDPLVRDGIMTNSEAGTMVALMDFGNLISPIPIAYLMNIIGRKRSLIISAVINVLASIAVLSYTNVYLIYIARILAGLSKGISFAVVPVYLAEVANVQTRGGLSTMFIGSLGLGIFYTYTIGPHLSYFWYNVAVAAIAILFSVTILIFPESPYYLLMKKRTQEARESMMKYRAVSASDTEKLDQLDAELTDMIRRVSEDMSNRGTIFDLIKTSGNRRAMLIICVTAFCQRGSGISPMLAFTPQILPNNAGGLHVTTYMILFSVLFIAGNYVAMPLVDYLGRKSMLIHSSYIVALATFCVGIFFYLNDSGFPVDSYTWVPYTGIIIYPFVYATGIGTIPSVLVAELLPTNIKSHASAVSSIMMAISSGMSNKLFEMVITSNSGIYFMFFFFTIMSTMCAVFTWTYVFETKGKSFTEIQNILQNKHSETEGIRSQNLEFDEMCIFSRY